MKLDEVSQYEIMSQYFWAWIMFMGAMSLAYVILQLKKIIGRNEEESHGKERIPIAK